jgi:8-oxo-dGTP pyrophosphatase MutT (NUDIX family)/phosphohistidine phosphatase SixA
MSPTVRAAGGVLWRPGPDGGVRVAVVHRPRYDDWSLPKGKLDPGEQALAAACREVHEETGFDVVAERSLGATSYRVLLDGRDVAKRVDWWALRAAGGRFTPSAEVDALEWLRPAEALARLTTVGYGEPLRRFLEVPRPTATVLLVRHAPAGSREQWAGDDDARPLDASGRAQAQALCGLLLRYAPRRVVAAPLRRCVATVQPVAQALGVDVELVRAVADEAHADDPDRTVALLRGLADRTTPTVVCSQGETIPDVVRRLAGRERLDPAGVLDNGDVRARKASVWALSFDDGRLVDACYLPPPVG